MRKTPHNIQECTSYMYIFLFPRSWRRLNFFRDFKVSKVHTKRARAGWSLGKGGSQGAEPRYRDPLNSKPPRPPRPGTSQRSPWRPVQQRIGPIGSLTPHHLLSVRSGRSHPPLFLAVAATRKSLLNPVRSWSPRRVCDGLGGWQDARALKTWVTPSHPRHTVLLIPRMSCPMF